ncbi:MAG TPA: protein kinase [Pyrinomonadaceae bacterium]|nr:protein kinase [Pyrinomonadaceae bacterium]
MNSAEWQNVKSILQEALDREPSQRADFVARKCGNNRNLSDEVLGLLDAEQTLGDFISEPAYVHFLGPDLEARDEGLSIGEKLGRYEIIAELGRGGMGTVYLGRDAELKRKVALKILPRSLDRSPDAAERFLREARIVSALNHPNVITIHEIGRVDSIEFIATEFVDGETLRKRISRCPLKISEAVDIGTQVMMGLGAAHTAGFIHRDIKPENVIIRKDGLVKVLDFGIAKLTAAPETPSQFSLPARPNSSIAAGTPKYMSPEQLRGDPLDQRTDLWSFGAVFFEMLTGVPPGNDYAAVLAEWRDLSSGSGFAEAATRDFVGKCLQPDLDNRYFTAADVLNDLQKIETAPATGAEARRTSRRFQYAAAAVALLILLTLTGTIVYVGKFRGAGSAPPEIRNLAVLPVTGTGASERDAYFEDGVTEDLINDLSRIADLRVISRTSVMRYKGKDTSLPEIAGALNVEAVVLTTVQRSAAAVRFSVKLVHATTGKSIWERGYERSQADLPALEKEITRDIARAISIKLTPRESDLLSNSRPVDPQAYEEYLKGRYLLNKRNAEALWGAITHFETSISKDSDFALSHAFLADAYFALGTEIVSTLPPTEALQKGGIAAAKAVELDDSLAEAHTSLGVIKLYSWQWAEAEASLKRALELNPNYSAAHSWYALYCVSQGRVGEAIARMYRARDLDPVSPHIAQNVGWMLHYAGQHEEEVQQYERALDLDPDFLFARRRLAGAYRHLGRIDAALAEHEKVIAIAGRRPRSLLPLVHTYAMSGRKAEARKILAEVMSRKDGEVISSYALAVAHAVLGDDVSAFELLNKAYHERSYAILFLKVTKDFDERFRRDPRFTDILRRLNLA